VENRTIDIKKRKDTNSFHPTAIFAHEVIDTRVLAEALLRIGEYVATAGIEGPGPYAAARDLLVQVTPQTQGQPLQQVGETSLQAGTRLAPYLSSFLPIQGPPGAGKTHTGARMICTLVQAGKKVGITANSHKVIRNLLDEVVRAAEEVTMTVQCVQKVSEKEDDVPGLKFTTHNNVLLEAIGGPCHVAAGTAWLWARPDAAEVVDVLFIDEAAQMSLANVLVVSQAAKSIVLLGDPRQLEAPANLGSRVRRINAARITPHRAGVGERAISGIPATPVTPFDFSPLPILGRRDVGVDAEKIGRIELRLKLAQALVVVAKRSAHLFR